MNGFFLNDLDSMPLIVVRRLISPSLLTLYLSILVPLVQSILPDPSTALDESAATSDVK